MKKIFLTTIIVSLFLIFFDKSVGVGWLRDRTQMVFTPIEIGLHRTGIRLVGWGLFIRKLPIIHRENQKLLAEVDSLLSFKVENENLRRENKILKEQLGVKTEEDVVLLEAKVLGGETRGTVEVLLLNKGNKDGVEKGMNVVLRDLLIGRVEESLRYHSVVLPVYSVHSKVPAVVVKDGEKIAGLAVGEFNSKVKLTKVLQEKKLEVGDLVVSSGQAGVYSVNLLIGEIAEIERKDNEIFQSAKLELFWDPQTLETVFVIQ